MQQLWDGCSNSHHTSHLNLFKKKIDYAASFCCKITMRMEGSRLNDHIARRLSWVELVKRHSMTRRLKFTDSGGKKQGRMALIYQDTRVAKDKVFQEGILYSSCKQTLPNIALGGKSGEVEDNLEVSQNPEDFRAARDLVGKDESPSGDLARANSLQLVEEVDLTLIDHLVQGTFECGHCHYNMERVKASFKAGKARMTCLICGWTTVRRVTLVRLLDPPKY